MIKSKFCILILLSFSLITSCEYEINEVYQRKVETNVDAPVVQNISLYFNEDTIYLYTNIVLNFNFTTTNQKIEAVEFTIDAGEGTTFYEASGKLNINYTGLSEGYHKLKANIFTHSGTNSIADRIGAEGYTFSKDWILKIIKNQSPKVETSTSNGYLKITWERYRGSNFINYIIYRKINTWDPDKIISRVASAEYIDTTYVGEQQKYMIKVQTENGILDWGQTEICCRFPKFTVEATDDNLYTLKWNKSPYYNAIKSITIYQDMDYYTFKEIKNTTNLNDTTCSFAQIYFGDINHMKIKIEPKTFDPYRVYQMESTVLIGFRFIESNSYIYEVSNDEFVFGNFNISRYSISQRRITETLPISNPNYLSTSSISASSSGKHFIANYNSDKTKYFYSESGSLKNYSMIKFPDIPLIYKIPISDLGTCVLHSYKKFYLYDINNSRIISEYKNDIVNVNCKEISSDGNYFLVEDDSKKLLHFDGTQFVTIGILPSGTKYMEFDKKDPSKFVIWDGKNMLIKDCATFNTIHSFPLTYDYFNTSYILNIDYYNKEFLTFNNYHLNVRSFEDGTILSDVPINPRNYNYQDNHGAFLLINHTIISKTGGLYFVN